MAKYALQILGAVGFVVILPLWLVMFFSIAAIGVVLDRVELYGQFNGNRAAQKRMNILEDCRYARGRPRPRTVVW